MNITYSVCVNIIWNESHKSRTASKRRSNIQKSILPHNQKSKQKEKQEKNKYLAIILHNLSKTISYSKHYS